MKQYKIPILYQCFEEVEVEADNLQAAVYQALKIFLEKVDNNYIPDSFEIDSIIDDTYPNEDYDINAVLQNI